MIRLLVSVRNAAEALLAADAGADLIDLKDPSAGALGGLPLSDIQTIVTALRVRPSPQTHPLTISATIGDHPVDEVAAICQRAAEVMACGVDLVKIGIDTASAGGADGEAAGLALVGALAALPMAAQVVPVFVADRGIPMPLVQAALHTNVFRILMIDTADKRGGSLLWRLPEDRIAAFVRQVRAAGAACGLAGALRAADAPQLLVLAPDIAGFRTAVCAGDRSGPLDAGRVRSMKQRLSSP